MFSKFSRILKFYFIAVTLLLLAGVSSVTYYFWTIGPMNADSEANVYEAGILTQELKKSQLAEQIKSHVLRNNIKSAQEIFNQIETNLTKINMVKNLGNEYRELNGKSADLKAAIAKLTTYPSTTGLLQVFHEKMSKFQIFTEQNHWQTLGRISERVLGHSVKMSPINFDANIRLIKSIEEDFAEIRQVVQGSTLTPENKALVNLRLNSVENELRMITRFLEDQKMFLARYETYQSSLNKWLKNISSELGAKKSVFTNNAKEFLQYLIGLVAVSATFLVGGVMLGNFLSARQKQFEESQLGIMLEKQLAAYPYKNVVKAPNNIDRILKNYHHYFHKRMSLGGAFGESLPFPALLLDQNMKVVWGNKIFAESWNIDEKDLSKELFSWDYLARYTNLENSDLLLESMRNNLAGIYQIDLNLNNRATHKAERTPFEMYVCPIDYFEQKRLMLYFYPMQGIEDSLEQQKQSTAVAIESVLLHLQQNSLTAETAENLQAEFTKVGQESLFNNVIETNQALTNQREALIQKIESLENIITEKNEAIDLLHKERSAERKELVNMARMMSSLKAQVIKQSDCASKMKESVSDISSGALEVLTTHRQTVGTSETLFNTLKTNSGPIDEMMRIKEDFKGLKVDLRHSKQRLIGQLDQSLMFKHLSSNHVDGDRLEQCLNKIRIEVNALDQVLANLEKKMTGLDVHLTKASLLSSDSLEKMDHVNMTTTGEVNQIEERFQTLLADAKDLQNTNQNLEEELIGSFKNIFSQLKVLIKKDEENLELAANPSDKFPHLSN